MHNPHKLYASVLDVGAQAKLYNNPFLARHALQVCVVERFVSGPTNLTEQNVQFQFH